MKTELKPCPFCGAQRMKVEAEGMEKPVFYTAFGASRALSQYASDSETGVIANVMSVARNQGYKGTADERMKELGWTIGPVFAKPQPSPPRRRKDRPMTNDTTPLSEFQENQWWIRELDEITSVRIGGTVPVTPDLQRAVAVVHNLLRVIAAGQLQQSAPVPLTDEQIQQGAIDCYVDDHLDFQAGVKTAERHHGITHKAEGWQP